MGNTINNLVDRILDHAEPTWIERFADPDGMGDYTWGGGYYEYLDLGDVLKTVELYYTTFNSYVNNFYANATLGDIQNYIKNGIDEPIFTEAIEVAEAAIDDSLIDGYPLYDSVLEDFDDSFIIKRFKELTKAA